MAKSIIFIHVQGDAQIIEVAVANSITESELHKTLASAGVPNAPDLFVFIDEAEEHISREGDRPVKGMKHGARVHVSRCRQIKTMVHFLDRTIEQEFPPGTRVHRVKKWATHAFHLDPKDGVEHILQLCNSTEQPASDTPLHTLVRGPGCAVCFDLVPEKRVEG